MNTDTLEIEKKELSPEELKHLRAEVIDKIVVARVGLLLRHPFFGNMATRLQIKECDQTHNEVAKSERAKFVWSLPKDNSVGAYLKNGFHTVGDLTNDFELGPHYYVLRHVD